VVAGNVFVRCNKGIRVLNSANVRIYNNTFVDAPASFERNERSATGDHFGWHPATGPDVDQREGHVFVNNLLVAGDAYRGPLLRFEQPRSLCTRLQRPQATEINGNVYVRAAAAETTPVPPLIQWSPTASDACVSTVGLLDEFRTLAPKYETSSQQLDRTMRSIFVSPDLGRYELLQNLPGTREVLPPDIRKFLNWGEEEARSAGAYPLRRSRTS
jgi:parallel beta-helix repeat protein